MIADHSQSARACGCAVRLRHVEGQFSVRRCDFDAVARFDVAFEQFFRERIFEISFNRAAHRTRAIIRIVTFFNHELVRRGIEHDLDLFRFDPDLHLRHLKIDNAHEMRFFERVEDNDLVQPIEKLGFKDALGLFHDLRAHRVVVVSFRRRTEAHHHLFLEQFCADVGRHDDDRVAKIDFAA